MRFTTSNMLKVAAVAGLLAVGGLSAASPAHADAGKYSTFAAALQHYLDCANWLLTDPAKHAQFCDPGHTVFVSSGGFGSPPVILCRDDDCEDDCCGGGA